MQLEDLWPDYPQTGLIFQDPIHQYDLPGLQDLRLEFSQLRGLRIFEGIVVGVAGLQFGF